MNKKWKAVFLSFDFNLIMNSNKMVITFKFKSKTKKWKKEKMIPFFDPTSFEPHLFLLQLNFCSTVSRVQIDPG